MTSSELHQCVAVFTLTMTLQRAKISVLLYKIMYLFAFENKKFFFTIQHKALIGSKID